MRKVYLSLTGGLGNQLFQIAAAISIANGDEIEVEWVNSRPRLNSLEKPEISDFTLPENLKFQQSHEFQPLNSKSIGYLIRAGVEPRRYEGSKFHQKVSSFLASIVNMSTFKKFIRIYANQGVGFSQDRILMNRRSVHLVGYFQTFRWIQSESARMFLMNLTVREKSPQLIKLMSLAEKDEPLIVHMRFGDYRLEETFGLLTPKYYQESIRELWQSKQFKSIWVFSDEIDQAQSYLEGLEIPELKFISSVSDSSAQTLEAMRLGKGYVIGNSSFSWWAASSAYIRDVPVIAPTPWFIGQTEPVDLIPKKWMRRMGHD
jgi:hypothetical protein